MNNLSVYPPLLRVAATATPYTRKPAAEDKVLDLSDKTSIPQEFNSGNIEFLKVKTDGKDLFLSLQDLKPEERTQLVNDLKALILNPNQEVSPSFDPNTFFSLNGDELTLGTGESLTTLSADVKAAQQVVTDSNARSDDAVWTFMNGGESSLSPAGASEHVGPQKKPGCWYNGFKIEGDKVTTHRSANDTRKDVTAPQLTLDQYKAMLVRDFNFNGAITTFENNGGADAFVASMQAKYPNHPLGAAGLETLARNIYSYATTGADLKGRTNIAEMQGMLYALDPEICKSSDSNTNMKKETFELDGMKIPLGDGVHGRATILTTRHLLANVETCTDPAPKLEVRDDFVFGKNDFFIRDGSGSMDQKWTSICGMINRNLRDRGLIDPDQDMNDRMQTLFDERDQDTLIDGKVPTSRQKTEQVTGGTGTYGQLDQQLDHFDQALVSAFDTLCPNGSKEEVDSFARLLGVPDDKINEVFPRSGGKRGLDAPKLMKLLADQTAMSGNQAYGAGGESGIKALITTLMFDPQFSPAAIEAMKPETPTINVVMDEPEQGLEYLELAKALANAKGVQVRLVVVPTALPGDFHASPEKYIATVDLNSLSISSDRTQATYTYTMMGQDPKTVTVPLYHSRSNKPLEPNEKPVNFQDLCLPLLFEPDPNDPNKILPDKPLQKRQGVVN